MKNNLSSSVLTVCAVALLLMGCSRKSSQPESPLPQPPAASRSEPGKRGGRLIHNTLGLPQTFNPLVAADAASVDTSHLLFGSLIRMDFGAQENVKPGLAESWGVAPDQRTWTFKLRRGVRWSDGTPLTADDVLFTWNELIYNSPFLIPAAELFQLTMERFQLTKIDDHTVQVVTPIVFAPFLEFFGVMPILPKHALAKLVEAKQFQSAFSIATAPGKIVCSGPYRVKQVNISTVILERNPEYWVVDSKSQRLPYFDEIVLIAARDPGTQTELFLEGETLLHDRIRPEEFEKFDKAAGKRNFQIFNLGAGSEKDFICFNQNTNLHPENAKPFVSPTKLAWFRNTKFRQAIASAVDRDRIVREVYTGRAVPAYFYVSPENKKWHNAGMVRFEHNPDKARRLLAEIGIEDRNKDGKLEDAEGNVIEFSIITNSENSGRVKTLELIREMLSKLGITVKTESLSFGGLIGKVNGTFDYECALLGLGGGGNDPATSWNVLRSDEAIHQWFPSQPEPSTEWEARIDQLMEAQMTTLDFAARKKAFDEVQAILAEQQPMIYTVSPNSYCAASLKIGNLRPTPLVPNRVSWNVEELFFK